MAINGQKIADALARLLPTDGSATDDARIVTQITEDTKEFYVPLTAAGQDLTLGLFEPRTTILVTECKVESSVTAATNATSYWTLQLKYDDGAGANTVNVTTTFSNSVTTMTAGQPNTLTLSTTGGVQVASGKRVHMVITGVDTVAVNQFGIRVKYKAI